MLAKVVATLLRCIVAGVAERRDCLPEAPGSPRRPGTAMPKGQEKPTKTNKPKLTPKQRQAKKTEKKAETA